MGPERAGYLILINNGNRDSNSNGGEKEKKGRYNVWKTHVHQVPGSVLGPLWTFTEMAVH